jgi:hypothetical protein
MRILQFHPSLDRAEIVAKMQIAGRLHAGKDAGHRKFSCELSVASSESLIHARHPTRNPELATRNSLPHFTQIFSDLWRKM